MAPKEPPQLLFPIAGLKADSTLELHPKGTSGLISIAIRGYVPAAQDARAAPDTSQPEVIHH